MTKTFHGKRVEDQLKALLLKYDDPNPIKLAGPKLAVLRAICGFANRETFLAWPSIPTIARLAGAADSTVRLHIKDLVREGWLEPAGKHRIPCRNGWNQYVNRFRVTLEKAEAALISGQEEADAQRTLNGRSTDAQQMLNGRSKVEVSAERDKSERRETVKVSAEPRGLTCTTHNHVSHVSDILYSNLPNLVEAEEQVDKTGLTSLAEEMTSEETSVQIRCYKLSSLKPCYDKTEHQLLRTLMKHKSLSHLHNLLDWITAAETAPSRFWRSRFDFDQHDKPVKFPVRYFCKSYPTMTEQYDFQTFPVQTTAVATATTTPNVSTGAAAQADDEEFDLKTFDGDFLIYRNNCECKRNCCVDDCILCSAEFSRRWAAAGFEPYDTEEDDNPVLTEEEMAFARGADTW